MLYVCFVGQKTFLKMLYAHLAEWENTLRWWSQNRLTREEVGIKRIDFKGATSPHACSLGHLTSFHLTRRPVWPHLFYLPASRDGCTGRDSVIFSFAISPVSCPDEMLAAHPLSQCLSRVWSFLASPAQRKSCRVFPHLCHPLPPDTLSDKVGVIFSHDPGKVSLMWVGGSVVSPWFIVRST